ncbi:MAG: hypothetical protein JNK25_13450 [Phycisphaerae bacterium]|nr:hypothetical protein [Phycisphaerae bacterium]
MHRKKKVNRPYVRQRQRLCGEGGDGPSRLAMLAGSTERPNIEQLERRQMLFSLTVTADNVDPNTGLGTVVGYAGYYLPYIASNVDISPTDPTSKTESFDQLGYGIVGSGGIAPESGLQIQHNINPAGDIRITAQPQVQDNQQRYLRVSLDERTEFVQFRFWDDGANPQFQLAAIGASFLVTADGGTDNTGILTDQTRLSLLYNNVVTQSFTGAALRALFAGGNANLGTGTLTLPANVGGFDTLRLELTQAVNAGSGINPAFRIDDVSFTLPSSDYAALLNDLGQYGFIAVLTGPVGATVNFRDLYGRDMRQTLATIPPPGTEFNPGDINADGIPDYNDGIGSIRFSGTDSRTSFQMWGGKITTSTTAPDGFDPFTLIPRIEYQAPYVFTLEANPIGLLDEMEDVGFAYAVDLQQDQFDFAGLPPGPASIIIGSPFIRNNVTQGGANPGGLMPDLSTPNPFDVIDYVTTGFNRPNQGIFLEDGSSMGSITIHGLVHGSSHFSGFVDKIAIGVLMGSITVDGDLGSLVVGGDAGIWSPDTDFRFSDGRTVDPNNKTNGQVIVGRTAGQILIGARSQLDVTIVGDTFDPQNRPSRDIYTYNELEAYIGVDPGTTRAEAVRQLMLNTPDNYTASTSLLRAGQQSIVLGSSFLRNDSILAAEFIGNAGTAARIVGDISGRDPFLGEDAADVFAFAADKGATINIQATISSATLSPYFRIMDQDGRTLAAPPSQFREGRFVATNLTWKADAPGVYYLVITDPNSNDTGSGVLPYSVTITGMAPATLGAFRTAGGNGFTDQASGEGSSISVLSGNVGSLRIGTGFMNGGGAETSPVELSNTVLSDDDAMSWQGGSVSVAGSLFNIITGSDIGPNAVTGNPRINVTIGGDLGSLYTGMSAVPGGDRPNEGDVNFLDLNVNGRIGLLDIRGGVGMDQDETDPRALLSVNSFNVFTGLGGGPGDIGMIRVGFHVAGDSFTVTTSPNSRIGAILVSQDAYDDGNPRSGVYLGAQGIRLNTGSGSDIRFADLPLLSLTGSADITYPLIGGQTLNLIDDGGARVQISVANAPPNQQVGLVRALPVNGSQGVVIGQIIANLVGGRTLSITSVTTSPTAAIGIGHILVTGDGASSIAIGGSSEIDVWRIEERVTRGQFGGADTQGGGLAFIENNSPNGDIIAVDVAGLGRLSVRGNLGRSQLPDYGPTLIGPFMGYSIGLVGEVGGTLGIPGGALLDDDFLPSKLIRAVNDDNFQGGQASLDDIGAPFSPYLNGVVIRAGNVAVVRAEGSLGDVILQGATAELAQATANGDRITPQGGFDGVIGSIFAFNITGVDVGDGIASRGPNPIASGGIFAINNLLSVNSSRPGPILIEGAISASNSVPEPLLTVADGINSISFTNAQVRGAYFGTQTLDGFWPSFFYGDDNVQLGDIAGITLNNSTFYNSEISTNNFGNFTLTGGFWDASRLRTTGRVGDILAAGFRNSTLTGSLDELRPSEIICALDVGRIAATNGDMSDLVISVTGRVRTGITATNITRSTIGVVNELILLSATNDIRASAITTGQLTTTRAGRNITASTFLVSGVITSFTATNEIINSRIEVTGPDGAIITVSARGISGDIAASGPITTVSATAGDLSGSITTTGSRGNVGTLSASRDLAIRTDLSGGITALNAGRNIGRAGEAGVILVRGDLASAGAPAGQLFNDLRVGGNITGVVTIGGVSAKPDANLLGRGSVIAFGRINSVISNGDFNGSVVSYSGGIASVAINNGSFLPGNMIAAYDGSLASVVITNGNLYGDIHADFDVTLLRVASAPGSVFGDVGINPARSAAVAVDANRNQLPPGVAQGAGIQGPRITAGRNLARFEVVNGSVFEASVYAQRAITAITVNGSVSNDDLTTGTGSFFAAGDSITSIAVTGRVSNTAFVSGVRGLGADNRIGGTGANADTIGSGSIGTISITGGTQDSSFSAGIDPGADGIYNTADDRSAFGFSTITALTLGGTVTNTSAFGDTLSPAVANDARLIRGGTDLPNTNPDVDFGSSTPPPDAVSFTGARTFTVGGVTYSITLTTGTAIFSPGSLTLQLRNTTATSNLTVSSSNGILNNFDIFGADDAALGVLTLVGSVTGDSDITIDGNVTSIVSGKIDGSGTIAIGGDITTATIAGLSGGFFSARSVGTLTINGDFGAANSTIRGEASISLLQSGAITITGASRGDVSVARDSLSLTLGGPVQRSLFRFGNSVGAITAPAVSQTIFSAGDSIGNVTINGDFFDSALVSGMDLGTDAFFGGTGSAADTLSSGTIGNVTVSGNFRESDITAGYARGNDGFFGTNDDNVAAGLGSIGAVTINGTGVGSTRSTENYRIASNGIIGPVRIGGSTFTGSQGNFAVEAPRLAPISAQVSDIRLSVDARVFTANLVFNQPIDFSTISPSLSVSEVRGNGNITIRLIQGVDYTLSYDATNNTVKVVFSKSVTERNLPIAPALPGPGIYRFEIDESIFKAKLVGIGIDGDGDGFSEPGDNFSGDGIVGDAGDKINPTINFVNTNGAPLRVDMYGATNLNFVMDRNATANNLPDPNIPYTVRGFIGDHPDNDNNFFRFAGDADVYAVTLQAGQILQLSGLRGTAINAGLTVFTATGGQFGQFADNAVAVSVPAAAGTATDQTFAQSYLIQATGTYYIVVGNTSGVFSPTTTPNPDTFPNTLGDYNFTITLFDDGDSGFNSATDSGDGQLVANAPDPISFAGADGVLGTSDDISTLIIGDYTFVFDRASGIVSGTNASNISTIRDASGKVTSTVNAAIGPRGSAGVPNALVTGDVDVFHLNNRQPIAAGTRMKITVKLADFGADLGSASPTDFQDNRGVVQFALFDTTGGTLIDDASLVFSPTDFLPYAGTPNTVIADNGETRYGFDAQGDFYIDFIVPERAGSPGANGTFAVMLQGAFNTDYQLEVITAGTGTITRRTQNVLIETNGGSVDWLQAGGFSTTIQSFDLRALGFTGGSVNGLPVNDYVLTNLVNQLNALFQGSVAGSGFDVRFSTNPADFEFEPFSTVYLSTTTDPLLPLFDAFGNAFNFNFLQTGFFNTQPFGFSQRSDPFNTDLEDDAVVFLPSFAVKGIVPDVAGLDTIAQALTGAVSRRVGELMGLRITADNGAATLFDPFAADSVNNQPGSDRSYTILNTSRTLSGSFDSITRSNFFLGRQNAVSLLDRVLNRR